MGQYVQQIHTEFVVRQKQALQDGALEEVWTISQHFFGTAAAYCATSPPPPHTQGHHYLINSCHNKLHAASSPLVLYFYLSRIGRGGLFER